MYTERESERQREKKMKNRKDWRREAGPERSRILTSSISRSSASVHFIITSPSACEQGQCLTGKALFFVDRGTSLIRSSAPWDPTIGLCLGPYGDPRGGGSPRIGWREGNLM